MKKHGDERRGPLAVRHLLSLPPPGMRVFYDDSGFFGGSFVVPSPSDVLIEATMGATAGAGVVDLFKLAAWSL